MKSLASVTRGAWLALAIGAVLAAVAAALWLRWPPRNISVAAEIEALSAEREQWRQYDDAACARLQPQMKGGAHLPLESLRIRFIDWQWTNDGANRAVLRRHAIPLNEWPRLIRTLDALRDHGARIEAVNFSVEGSGASRRFAEARISVGSKRIVATSDDADRTAPSRGPLRVVPGRGRPLPGRSGASLRSTGPTPPPSLRLPGRLPLRSVPTRRGPGPASPRKSKPLKTHDHIKPSTAGARRRGIFCGGG